MKMSKTIALAKVQEIDKISDGPRPHTPPCQLPASAAWATGGQKSPPFVVIAEEEKRLRQLQAAFATSTCESSGNAKCKALDFYIKYFPTFAAYLV